MILMMAAGCGKVSSTADVTPSPDVTSAPDATPTPTLTSTPAATPTPTPTSTPVPTELPDTSGICIDASNFPDEIFRTYVSNEFDTNSDGYLSEKEVNNAVTVDVTWEKTESLEGIQYFTNLEDIYAAYTRISSLPDLSGCPSLKRIICSGATSLKTIDLSGCLNLIYLDLGCCCSLSNLDVSKCLHLQWLYCNDTNISSLDVSGLTELTYLGCYEYEMNMCLSSLNVTGCTALEPIYCKGIPVSSLDVSTCVNLKNLDIRWTGIRKIDITNCTKLDYFMCDNNVEVIK